MHISCFVQTIFTGCNLRIVCQFNVNLNVIMDDVYNFRDIYEILLRENNSGGFIIKIKMSYVQS